ncbi:MAG: endonuclease/exonuclease/phosphatase family protein, partial [Planctomycetota bacterium]
AACLLFGLAAALSSGASSGAHAQPIQFLSWNLESDGADPEVVARQLGEFPKQNFYCFQEVNIRHAGRFGAAIRAVHGNGFRYLTTNTGRDDRLMIMYDTERFDLIESRELFRHGEHSLNQWRHRSPLVLVLKEKATGRGFNLMTVHLARGDRRFRKEQAIGLREWAASEPRPTIAIGDFNFDYDIPTGRGNASFNAFLDGGAWTWVKPDPLVDTNYDDRDGDGKDNYPASCLDFAFTAGEGLGPARAEIIVRPGDFPDDERTPDHRPIRLIIDGLTTRR